MRTISRPLPGFANGTSCDDRLRPAEADLVEIKIRMLRADVVKDLGNRAANTRIEPFYRIEVDSVANIFAAGVLYGLMPGETLTNGHERLRLVAHQA